MNVFLAWARLASRSLAALLLTSYRNWHAPMIAFAVVGFAMMAIIAVSVRPWFSETHRAADARSGSLGAPSLFEPQHNYFDRSRA